MERLQDLRGLKATFTPDSGPQVIDNQDFFKLAVDLEAAHQLCPGLIWLDAATLKIAATADSPAALYMLGFPNILQTDLFLSGGLSDGSLRFRTSQVTLIFPTNLWGSEKNSQWHTVLAVSGPTDPDFTLKAMPYLRVKSQAGQVISLGTNLTPATGIGYGWGTDQFADGSQIYVLTGVSAGLLRPISANNNDNAAGGTLTYAGADLSLAAGDWLIILPATNFRRLGDVYNNAAGNITQIDDFIVGKFPYVFTATPADPWWCPLAVAKILETGIGAGGRGWTDASTGLPFPAAAGVCDLAYPLSPTPGTPYNVTVGSGPTSLGALRTLAAGGGGTVNTWSLGPYGAPGYGDNGYGTDGVLILNRAPN